MSLRVSAVMVTCAAVLSSCSDRGVATEPALACEPFEGSAPTAPFDVLDLEDLVVILERSDDDTGSNAEGLANAPLVEAYASAYAAAQGSGWQIINVENDGIDAEILLSSPSGELLGIELLRGSCLDQSRVYLSYLAE